MKNLIIKEFLFLVVALIVAFSFGFLFLYIVHLEPVGTALSEDEKVLEMDLFVIGCLLGFTGVYLVRLLLWAVKKMF